MQSLETLLSGPMVNIAPTIRQAYNNRSTYCYRKHLYSEDKFAQCISSATNEIEQK
jgi:hypothetical protein